MTKVTDKETSMDAANVEEGGATGHSAGGANFAAGPAKGSYKLWIEKPVGRFCVGFFVFVFAEVLVLVTLHWIFHII